MKKLLFITFFCLIVNQNQYAIYHDPKADGPTIMFLRAQRNLEDEKQREIGEEIYQCKMRIKEIRQRKYEIKKQFVDPWKILSSEVFESKICLLDIEKYELKQKLKKLDLAYKNISITIKEIDQKLSEYEK